MLSAAMRSHLSVFHQMHSDTSHLPECAQVLGKVLGSELVGTGYQPLFPYFAHLKADSSIANGTAKACPGAFRVVADGYVTADNGTGIVHCAPAFGEDDMRVCLANSEPDPPRMLTSAAASLLLHHVPVLVHGVLPLLISAGMTPKRVCGALQTS
jgi:isoleucyl-tRNA synthetase